MAVLLRTQIEVLDGQCNQATPASIREKKMVSTLVLSEANEILQPALHDGKLHGVLLIANDRLLISVETESGDHHRLVCSGVERLRVDDFRQGNVILDITITTGADIDLEDVAYAYGIEPQESPFLRETMQRLVQAGRIAVRINPSYGCCLVCICSGIEVREDFVAVQQMS